MIEPGPDTGSLDALPKPLALAQAPFCGLAATAERVYRLMAPASGWSAVRRL
jgi:hypothetical protein